MWIYILIIVLSILLYFAHGDRQRMSPQALGAVLFALALFVGLADMLGGYDRYIYAELFDGVADNIRSGQSISDLSIFKLYGKELGYIELNAIIAKLTANRYIFILIVTLIIYALILYSMLKYTNRSPLVIVLFLGLWFFFTFTYLRQVLAASIVWLAIRYAIDRKPIPYFAIVLLAFSFHNSAILFAPIYFLPVKKPKVWSVIAIMIACFAIGMTNIAGSLFEQYGDITDQEQRMAMNIAEVSGAFRIDYLLEAIVFLTLIFVKYDDVNKNNKTQVMMCNLAFVFCAILLLFIRNENGGRLSWYFMIGIISIISFLATKRKGLSSYGIAISIMSLVLFIRITVLWGENGYQILYPYKTFLTNGYRVPDKTHKIYEYDNKYDEDKFYR